MKVSRVLLCHGSAKQLSEEFPGRVGLLVTPDRVRPTHGMYAAGDNGRYACWFRNKTWDEGKFFAMLDKCYGLLDWVAVPDLVADAAGTFDEWAVWEPRLRGYGCKLALVVQDGMTPKAVKKHANPDVIFVGGTTAWKRATLWSWCRSFERVHCGRVNTEKWLWNVHRCGVESSDGTGWFRGDKKRRRGLLRYLRESSQDMKPAQLELAYARF